MVKSYDEVIEEIAEALGGCDESIVVHVYNMISDTPIRYNAKNNWFETLDEKA